MEYCYRRRRLFMSFNKGAPQGPPSGEEELAVGEYIGKHRVIAELGRGGMANVYLTLSQGAAGLKKLVALKVLRRDALRLPEMIAMFLDEARLAAQLNHANIVKTYEVGSEAGRPVIVMEYLEGQALSAVLRKGRTEGKQLPLPIHLRVLLMVLQALNYAHELTAYDGSPLRIVHRDVTPHNVFLTYDGPVKLVDFGIAKAATTESQTISGVIKGTLSYIAPEQMVASSVDRRADIYSIGCMLWAAAAEEKLWKGMPAADIAHRVMTGQIPAPSSINPACSPELERIVMKALMLEPERRYSTASELQEALEEYCERTGLHASEKDVGGYVSALFAETRAQLRSMVADHLRAHSADGATPVTGIANRNEASANGVAGVSRSEIPTEVIPLPRPSRRRWVLLLALPVLAVGGLFAQRQLKLFQTTTAAHKAPASVAPPAVAAPTSAAPANVTYELKADPPNAQLVLDGRPLSGNPVSKLLEKGSSHRVSASVDGYEPATREFISNADGALHLSLRAVAPMPSGSTASAKVAGRKPASPRPLSTPVASANARPDDCDERPFYIDSEGRKAIRRECL